MSLLEFRLDEVVLREDCEFQPELADATALQETYFVMPVRLYIDGVELLEVPAEDEQILLGGNFVPRYNRSQISSTLTPWLPLPILSVATVGLKKVQLALAEGKSDYFLPGGGHLLLERVGTSLRVTSTVNKALALADGGELLGLFEQFAANVRTTLVRACPQLAKHPSWGAWFRASG